MSYGRTSSSMHEFFEVWIFMQVPNVKWDDVGGLEDVKKSILDTVQVGFLYVITSSVITFPPNLEVQLQTFEVVLTIAENSASHVNLKIYLV